MPTAGYIDTIVSAIESAVSIAMTDFDFSVSGRVLRGIYLERPPTPLISISSLGLRSTQGPGLQQYERAVQVALVATAPTGEAPSVDTTSRWSLALLHQVSLALETARADATSALYSLRGFTVDSGIDLDSTGQPLELASAYLDISFIYRNPTAQAGL